MKIFLISALNKILKISNTLFTVDNVESFSNIITNIIVIIGGVFGILYLQKLREKQIDATFSYLARLKIRLQYILDIMIKYKLQILDRFIISNKRRNSIANVATSSFVLEQLALRSKETIQFLMDSDDQVPASENWLEYCDILLEFLEDCEKLLEKDYYKWVPDKDTDTEKLQEEYYEKHKTNIELMLNSIRNNQKEIQEKLFKKRKKVQMRRNKVS